MPRRRPFRRALASLSPARFSRASVSTPTSSASDAVHAAAEAAVSAGWMRSASPARSGFGVEALEHRLLFTRLGGVGTTGQVEYFNLSGGQIRIAWHDMTFEVVDAIVPMGSTQAMESDPIRLSPTAPTSTLPLPNIYAIYILQSSLDSYLSIAAVPSLTATGDRPMLPFGGAPTLNVFPAEVQAGTTTATIAAPVGADVGSVLLGAITTTTVDPGLPVMAMQNLSLPDDPFPGNGVTITPGIHMMDHAETEAGVAIPNGVYPYTPNDVGHLFFGGVITGDVEIPAPATGLTIAPEPASQGGNVGVFYAGAILTGDTEGVGRFAAGQQAADNEAANFSVGGDVRDLITAGAIGGGRGAIGRVDLIQYRTDLRMVIAGSVGEINSRTGGFYGSLDVLHAPGIYGLPNDLFDEHELEVQDETDPLEPGDYFGPNAGGVLAQEGDIGIDYPLLASDVFDNNVSPTDITTEGDGQYLGSIAETSPDTGKPVLDAAGNIVYYATVDGAIESFGVNAETVDNYALPLLAGQTIQPRLTLTQSGLFQAVQMSLIDPDGRVVANQTVESSQTELIGAQTPAFQYTADRPGIYYIRLTEIPIASTLTADFYNLVVTGVGNLGLGSLVTGGGDISDNGESEGIRVNFGDAGAFVVPTGFNIASVANTTPTIQEVSTIQVDSGSLRVLKGGSIGTGEDATIPVTAGPFGDNGQFGSEPVLGVPNGQIGLIEAIDATGLLDVATPFDSFNAANVLSDAFVVPTVPVGGDVQMIDGQGTVFLDIATNQGIGDILAGNMATIIPSFIDVNADNAGNDGVIDLVSVSGNLGTLDVGGPAFLTHTGGYVRYMHVTGAVFQDAFFGNPDDSMMTGAVGAPMTYTEDTGATLTFTPQGTVTTTTTTANGATTTTSTGPQIQLLTYGIRDKGGGVIINAQALDGSMTITANGGNGSASADIADISEINAIGESTDTVIPDVNAAGLPVVGANGEQELTTSAGTASATNGTTTTTSTDGTSTVTTTISGATSTSSININGSDTVDVLTIVADTGGTGNFDTIANNTPGGEIDNIGDITGTIGSIISAGTIGLVHSDTPAVVTLANDTTLDSLFSAGNSFPWDLQTTGIHVTGNVMTIRAANGLGNINVEGTIGSLIADFSGTAATGGVLNGIDAPVLAGSVTGTTAPEALTALTPTEVFAVTGNINNVRIGQGVAPSGTGDFSFAGLYADGDIGSVTNLSRANDDVRGSIVAEDKLGTVTLGNASIINATIGSAFPLAGSQLMSGTGLTLESLAGQTNQALSVARISITGRGGIIGSTIFGESIGPVSVASTGFGVFNTLMESSNGGLITSVQAGGYGIRDTNIIGGATIGSVSATGNGSELPVTAFGTDVRGSASGQTFDPYSGLAFNANNDIDAFLGSSTTSPTIAGTTDTGVLQDDSVESSIAINAVSAQTIRTDTPIDLLDENEPQANIPRAGQTFPMELNAASTIGSVNVRGTIAGLQITTGKLTNFHENGSVSRLGISVAGTIASLTITGTFGALITDPGTGATIPDSFIQATGPQGTIGNLTIDGNLNGSVTANVAIQNMTVNGNIVGNVTALGQTRGTTLGTLRIGGTLTNGSLTIDGPAGSIISNGSLGSAGGTITVDGSLKMLEVGAVNKNSTLMSAVDVKGTLGKLLVNGTVAGAVTVTGDLTTMRLTGIGSGNVLTAPLMVDGRIYNATVVRGNIDADITANGFIKNFTVQDGSVEPAATIASQLDAIDNFKITGGTAYSLLGSLDAPNSTNGNVDISGNLGDGIDPASIIEGSGKRFHIRGSILSDASITVSGALAQLLVDGNIATGATVAAHPLTRLTVRGTNTGTVTQT